MDNSNSQRTPVEKCPDCGAAVGIDILYHGPGADGFSEYCTKCEWSRESHFTSDNTEIEN